jgi:hypothetical protein
VSGSITCFLLTPIDRAVRSLRRYTSSAERPCSSRPSRYSYCNASAIIGEEDFQSRYAGEATNMTTEEQRADPRWPATCESCGRPFEPDDEWQINCDRLYVRSDDGTRTIIRAAAPGAMWVTPRFQLQGDDEPSKPGDLWCGPDGLCVCLKLPDGTEWVIDGPATNGPVGKPGWTRTGTPPRITVHPSILTPGYHGVLTDGVLTQV